MNLAIDWQSLHLLRPWWLLSLLPALWLAWRSWHSQNRHSDWSNVVDAELLPHLLDSQPSTSRRWWPLFLLIAWIITAIALSGPAWKKLPQPLYMQESALVILLDLSRSMDAEDITPSRLTHARLKVLDLLEQRQEGQTGLVVYTNEAFVVAPLTDDNRTIANLVPSLSSDVMPSQGSQLSVAIQRANKLLDDAGFQSAQLLVISDGVTDAQAFTLAQQLADKNRQLSTLAIGSDQGSPIALKSGGFLKNRNGAIVISKADHGSLQRLAAMGGGRYTPLRHDGSDLSTLFPNQQPTTEANVASERQQSQQQWRDEGIWLLLPILLIAAFAFRRGWLFSMFFCAFLINPQPSYALEWDTLWQSNDQQAAKAMQQQEYQQAAEQFEDPLWQASALYRAGEYQRAADLYAQYDSAEAHYNRANALVKAGNFPEASKAYESALKKQPDHQDSQFNLELLKSLMEQQSQDQESNSDQQGEDGEQQEGESQQSGEQGEESQSGEQSGESQQGQSGEQSGESSAKSDETDPSDGESAQQASESAEQSEEESDQSAAQESEESTETADGSETEQQSSEQDPAAEQDGEGLTEQQQYMQQWLRRIPDDPGGLLRRKFQQQHQPQSKPQENQQPW